MTDTDRPVIHLSEHESNHIKSTNDQSPVSVNQSTNQSINQLPQVLIDWLIAHKLSPSIYEAAHSLPRYIRLNPRKHINQSDIEKDFNDGSINQAINQSPIKDCFSLPSNAMIANAPLYKSGAYYGIDLASMIAARSLMANPKPVNQSINQSINQSTSQSTNQSMHVLDLCCAPGAKLCLLYDIVSTRYGPSTNQSINQPINQSVDWSITGVDCSLDRISITRNMATKYGVKARFFCGDGRTFAVPPPSINLSINQSNNQSVFITNVIQTLTADGKVAATHMTKKQKRVARRTNPSTNKRQKIENQSISQSSTLNEDQSMNRSPEPAPVPSIDDAASPDNPQTNQSVNQSVNQSINQSVSQSVDQSINLYDRVLVDAECTHDGSVKHILKFEQWGWETFERRFLNNDRLIDLQSIQRGLLSQGWENLTEGGEIIYSTCSFLTEQNEDIVEWFLSKHGKSIEMLPVFEGDVVSEHQEMTDDPTNQSINQSINQSKRSNQCLYWRRGFPFKSDELKSVTQQSVRLDPATSGTSGLFIAKFRKLPLTDDSVEIV